MDVNRKQRLMKLGSAALSDALLEMAVSNEKIDTLINRMISTPKENIIAFKKRLASLKRSTKFVDWKKTPALIDELSQILADLAAANPDPCLGLELVSLFYETDDSVFSRIDDSNGSISWIYSFDAKELFVHYAPSCRDTVKIVSILVNLCLNDQYGVRSPLFDSVHTFLEEPMVRLLIDKLQVLAANTEEAYKRTSCMYVILSLAKQIKDAKLVETTLLAIRGEGPPAILEITQAYLDSDDVETAFTWIQKFPKTETFQRNEYTNILTEIYTRQGDTANLVIILKKKLRVFPTKKTLEELLTVHGEDEREAVITEEVAHILSDATLHLSKLSFLFDCDKNDEAEDYLLARSTDLDGSMYISLLPIARTFEKQTRYLASALIYRSLLDSILERAYTKSYPYGVRYLQKLDALDHFISDWKGFLDHMAYKGTLVAVHGRKRSFWSQYDSM